MQNLYVHQHTRLGDMILCNALIRILSKKNIKKKLIYFVVRFSVLLYL